MSPQLLWTIAGLVLTVLTLGGVSISSYQSMDSATAKLIASEVGNVAIGSKLWISNKSTDGTFVGITPEAMATFIPDLVMSGTGATSVFASKASSNITFAVASSTPYSSVVITLANMTPAQGSLVATALASKACAVSYVALATTATYTCNG